MTNSLKRRLLAAAIAVSAFAASPAFASILYTQSNASAGNQIQVFESTATGALVSRGAVSTGGLGTGGGLGNQGALAFADNERFLIAVNAGSNDLSVFHVGRERLTLVGRFPSGGVRPVSVAVHDDLVYVVNAGGSGSVSGFNLQRNGSLRPIENSTRPLSTTNAGPAQVGFNRDGDILIVTERATNRILSFPVRDDGRIEAPFVNASSGPTPFGFEFDRRDNLLVSEAFGGAPNVSSLSSYDLADDNGQLTPITRSASTGQTAACWVVTAFRGRFAYVTNTASGTVTGYSVARGGEVERLGDPITGATGGGPTDAFVIGADLYVLSPPNGEIVEFEIARDGALKRKSAVSGVAVSATGLLAR